MKIRLGQSLRVRLVALFVGIFGINLVVFSALLYRAFVNNHEDEFDVALYNYAVDVAQMVDIERLTQGNLSTDALAASEKIFPFALGETYLQLRMIDGTPIAHSRSLKEGGLPMTRDDREELEALKVVFHTIPGDQLQEKRSRRTEYRLVMVLIDRPGIDDVVLQVAAPMKLIRREKRGLLTFFLLSVPAVLCFAAFGGLYLSRRALAPFDAIIRKAESIKPGQLAERVPVPPGRDEIHRLAVALNDLLERIEVSFRSQEKFIADASHQLKTPLAILRGELDVLRSKARTPQENQAFFESASQEITHLSKLVENLLLLARIDTGEACLERERVRMDEIALECVSRLERIGREKQVRLVVNLETASDGASVNAFEFEGDGDLLRILLENLVENAVKYSPVGGSVAIRLCDSPSGITAIVEDEGSGIDPAALPRIFERFYRARDMRKVAGSGLGLAIAQKVAEIHGGRIVAANRASGGAQFTVVLPKNSADLG